MTVSTSTNRVQYNTNGTTGPWSVPFYFLESSHLSVTYTTAAGVETLLALTTNYSVTGAGDPAGGSVTTVTAYASGGTITILRSVPATQETDYVETDSFPAEAHEAALDKLTMIVQQQNEVLDRAITFPPSEDSNGVLPSAVTRAGMLCAFDASGNVTVSDPGNVALSSADFAVARAKRLVVGFDDDSDITDNASALANNSLLVRYTTAYSETGTENGVQVQRYIQSSDPGRGSSFKADVVIGSTDGVTTTEGSYPPEWGINIAVDSYSTDDTQGATVGGSFTVRRYSDQQTIGIHCNAMDMRIPQDATDPNMGGVTGMECHADGIGPDHRTGNNNYGYRQALRITARTQSTQPDWVKRGTAPYTNGATVSVDDICLPKDAVLSTEYLGTYFVCTTGGVLGGTDTVLDAATTPGSTVTDGAAVWECRVGAEIGIGIIVKNGDENGVGNERPAYYRYGIIVDNGEDDGNLNQVYTAFYAKNSGTINYASQGSPTYHAWFNDETGECTVYLGTELNANGSTISSIIHKGNNSSGVAKTYANFETYIVDGAAGSEDGRILFTAMVAGAIAPHLYLEGLNTIVGTKSVLATTATAGFLHVGRCAGAPTGVPDLYTGKCPMVVDSTNGRLYVYHSGGWHYATLT